MARSLSIKPRRPNRSHWTSSRIRTGSEARRLYREGVKFPSNLDIQLAPRSIGGAEALRGSQGLPMISDENQDRQRFAGATKRSRLCRVAAPEAKRCRRFDMKGKNTTLPDKRKSHDCDVVSMSKARACFAKYVEYCRRDFITSTNDSIPWADAILEFRHRIYGAATILAAIDESLSLDAIVCFLYENDESIGNFRKSSYVFIAKHTISMTEWRAKNDGKVAQRESE